MRLRSKLFASLALATLVPSVVIGIACYRELSRELLSNHREALAEIARISAISVENYFSERRGDIRTAQDCLDIKSNLETIATHLETPERPDYIRAKAELDEQLKTFQDANRYEDVLLVDTEGRIVYSTNDEHAGIDLGQPLPDPGQLSFEAGKRDIYISDPFLNERWDDKSQVLVTAPLHNFSGQWIGVIALQMDMGLVYQLLNDSHGLGETGETLLGRRDGDEVLFLSPLRFEPNAAMRKRIPIEGGPQMPIIAAAQGQQVVAFGKDYDRRDVLAAGRYLPGLGWGLISKIERQEVLAAAGRLRNFTLTLGSCLVAALGLLSLVAVRSFLRPLKELEQGMSTVRDGDLTHVLPRGSDDEIGSLSVQFNGMVKQLRSRTEHLDDMREALDQACIVAVTDQRGIIQSVNDKFCEITQFSRAELVGQDHRIINSGQHSKAFIKDLWTTIANGKTWQGDFKNKARDGTFYWVASTIVPFLNEDGRPYQYLAIRTDITSQKNIEQELRATLESLEQSQQLLAQRSDLLSEMVTQLETAMVESEAANKAKSEFLTTMSHEIRTPMNGILGMTQLVLETDLDATQRDFMETIRSSGDTLLVIINAVLDSAKIASGKLTLENNTIDLCEVLEETVSVMAGPAQAKGLNLIAIYPPGRLRPLRGDSTRLRQVLVNLIGNATKFTEAGQIVVRLMVIDEGPDAHRLRFEVSDTGVGMTEEAQGRIFQAFSQADSSTTRKYGGTGLGLSICKQLIELMEGELGVQSTLGSGSTFWFTVRLDLDHGEPLKTLERNTQFVGRKVLIVAEPDELYEQLAGHLDHWQLVCQQASSTAEALRRLRDAAGAGEPFELALLDGQVQGADALELARQIGNDASIPELKLALLSEIAFCSVKSMQAAGMASHLTKPVRQSQLHDLLFELLAPAAPRTRPKQAASRMAQVSFDASVLLVEDNRINQIVAQKFLARMGCRVVVAGDGLKALEQLEQSSFDLVLMDCQMPVMDGFESVRQIRKRGTTALSGFSIPVIALTADVIDGVRERCLEAGMDDYLSKPFKAEQLSSVLEKWLAVPADPAALCTSQGELNLDPKVIDELIALQAGDEPDAVQQLILDYLKLAPGLIDEIQQAVARGDSAAAELKLLDLNSSSERLGAKRLAELCDQLKQACREQRLDELGGLAGSIAAQYGQVAGQLTTRLHGTA